MTVKVEAEIDAPVARVWSFVGNFAGLMRWHPLVTRCEVKGDGVGAHRKAYFQQWSAEERLDALDHNNHILQYHVTAGSKPETVGVHARIRLTPLSEKRTKVTWESWFDATRADAERMDEFLASTYTTRLSHLRDALANEATL